MLFSRQWLGEYVELPADVQELARRLTFAGFAVEQVKAVDEDFLLDVDVTTNRPDCMNHFGLAREIAVLFDTPLQPPAVALREAAERAAGAAKVVLQDPAGCPRYLARVLRGVRVGESPGWLKARLESIGQRAINNVVDVANFCLWELGQPMHAFDLAKLAGATVVVRRARAGESLVTLDGQARELAPETLVIADAERPVALAGVLGGLDSEVTEGTTDILLESAHFDRQAVRVTARRLGIHTDASHRFERGADILACAFAAERAAALIAELAGGTVLAGAVDERGAVRPPARGRLELARLEAFAGAAIPPVEVERWLAGLGFAPRLTGAGEWEVTVPSWRAYDVEARPWIPGSARVTSHVAEVYPQDLYEEVLRLFGFDRIPAALPAIAGADGHPNAAAAAREKVRQRLAACGYAEAINFAFIDPRDDAAYPSLRPGSRPLALANPLSERYSVLRRSLVPGLVDSARFNQRRGAAAVRLFEVGSVFFERAEAGDSELANLPQQPETIALVAGGTVGTPWERRGERAELDLFDLKGTLESLAESFGVRLDTRTADLRGLLAGSAAELVSADGAVVGFFGRVEAEEGYPLFAAELAATALTSSAPSTPSAAPEAPDSGVDLRVQLPSRFPGIGVDLTLTHGLSVPWSDIRAAIATIATTGAMESEAARDLVDFGLKDRYRGPGVPAGAVNTTLYFLYNSRQRSLTQEEVNGRHLALAAELQRRFGWKE